MRSCGTHYRRLYMVLVASGLVLVLGCSDNSDKKKGKQASDKRPTPAAVEGLEAIPESASAVIGIDVARLASSPLVERAVERMFARDPELEGELRGVLRACEINPQTDIKSATIALLPRGEDTDSLLVTKGKYSEAVITACLGRFLSEAGGRLESAEAEGRSIYHQVGGAAGDGVWLAFGSSDTLLVASSREALALSLGKGGKLGSSDSGLATYLPRLATEHALWAVGRVQPAVAEGLVAATGSAVEPPIAILGSADLEGGLTVQLEVEMRSTKDAKELISQAQMQIQAAALVLQVDAAGRLVQKIAFSSDKTWAQLHWQLSEQELADLVGANLSGLSSPIDKDAGNNENPAPQYQSGAQSGAQNPTPNAAQGAAHNAEKAGDQDHGKRNPDANR